jgi:hypothetical protein
MARSASVEGAKTFHELIGIPYTGQHMVIFLYLIGLLLVGFTLFVTRLIRMPMGRAWEALREDEIACRSLGLNPRIKLSAFTLGASFAGLAARSSRRARARQSRILHLHRIGADPGRGRARRHGFAAWRDPGCHPADRAARGGARLCRVPDADLRSGDGADDDVASAGPAARKPSPRGVAAMSAEMLKVSGLQMRFGGLLAVDGIEFDVRRDEVFAIIGPNGAGKTTVFNCVGGFYKPTAGEIMLDGHSIARLPSHQVARRGLVRTFQNIRLFKQLTVVENLWSRSTCR